jgi:hypothetical protein
MWCLTASAWRATSKPATSARPSLSRSRPQQAAKHAEGGALGGAVGPEKPEDLAAGHLEIDPVHGGEAPEAAGQVQDDHRRLQAGALQRRKRLDATGCLGADGPPQDADKDILQAWLRFPLSPAKTRMTFIFRLMGPLPLK